MPAELSKQSVGKLRDVITGDGGISPYRSGPELVEFFNQFGWDDTYGGGGGFPSRRQYAEEKLKELNGTDQLDEVVRRALDPRHFLDTEHDLEQVVDHLNKFLEFDDLEIVEQGREYRLFEFGEDHVDLTVDLETVDSLNEEFAREQLRKCHQKIQAEDYDGAITNARSLLEALLRDLEKRVSGEDSTSGGDLVSHYNHVSDLLNLHPKRDDISTPLKQVLSGLNSIVSGIAGTRNKMSDAHARTYEPDKRHAELVVNATKTLVNFLYQSLEYQKDEGLLE